MLAKYLTDITKMINEYGTYAYPPTLNTHLDNYGNSWKSALMATVYDMPTGTWGKSITFGIAEQKYYNKPLLYGVPLVVTTRSTFAFDSFINDQVDANFYRDFRQYISINSAVLSDTIFNLSQYYTNLFMPDGVYSRFPAYQSSYTTLLASVLTATKFYNLTHTISVYRAAESTYKCIIKTEFYHDSNAIYSMTSEPLDLTISGDTFKIDTVFYYWSNDPGSQSQWEKIPWVWLQEVDA